MQFSSNNLSFVARLLGFAGLIPFVALAALSFAVSSEQRALLVSSLLAYAVTIVSFLGAIHWGLTMVERPPRMQRLAWGVVPSLLGWVSLMVPVEIGLCIVAAVLLSCLVMDYKIYPQYGLDHWLGMRLVLSLVAMVCTVLPALAGLRWLA